MCGAEDRGKGKPLGVEQGEATGQGEFQGIKQGEASRYEAGGSLRAEDREKPKGGGQGKLPLGFSCPLHNASPCLLP